MEKTFTLDGVEVKVITVFHNNENPTALVEDSEGNIFHIKESSLVVSDV